MNLLWRVAVAGGRGRLPVAGGGGRWPVILLATGNWQQATVNYQLSTKILPLPGRTSTDDNGRFTMLLVRFHLLRGDGDEQAAGRFRRPQHILHQRVTPSAKVTWGWKKSCCAPPPGKVPASP
jgi:hypothetical protein